MSHRDYARRLAARYSAMARANRDDATAEEARGNVLVAKGLRSRADEYDQRAAELLREAEQTEAAP